MKNRMIHCSKCGHIIEDNDRFCVYCGAKATTVNEEKLNGFDIVLIIVSFLLPLIGIGCTFIVEKESRAHRAINISTIAGFSIQILLILVFILFVVMWVRELVPYIQEGMDASAHFFEVF